ncbi:hypothetical protein IWX49DRAFT_321035 [Phyllosticta citricarpa]|uniref:Uncharacterized protein n=2 Tax=Phyllosticta TaxID=121621 RepID=A0ABR1LDR8_9PEZI
MSLYSTTTAAAAAATATTSSTAPKPRLLRQRSFSSSSCFSSPFARVSSFFFFFLLFSHGVATAAIRLSMSVLVLLKSCFVVVVATATRTYLPACLDTSRKGMTDDHCLCVEGYPGVCVCKIDMSFFWSHLGKWRGQEDVLLMGWMAILLVPSREASCSVVHLATGAVRIGLGCG